MKINFINVANNNLIIIDILTSFLFKKQELKLRIILQIMLMQIIFR